MKPALSHVSASRAAILLMLALGAIASLAMLVVMLAMTMHVTRGVMAAPATSSAPRGPASEPVTGASAPAAAAVGTSTPASSSDRDLAASALAAMSAAVATMAAATWSKPAAAPEKDDTKDAVANAMTAVGTAIAAVTLILSVGTTWFAQRLKEVDKAMVELDRMHGVYRAHINHMSAREATATQTLRLRLAPLLYDDHGKRLSDDEQLISDEDGFTGYPDDLE